jgi:glutamate synthase (NADPH/NADH) large chain
MILRRFTTGAMSLGALGTEAHESLALAMNSIGAKSNSGEGGEDAGRFNDNRNSAIKQIASARFGVTAHYLANAIELQIKMAQGAKPGEGGQLPGHKVDGLIAGLRHATPGVTLISPPPHHDIYSIEDLAQLIFDLKKSNPLARISVKLVAEAGIGTVAAGVAKAMADKIVISGDSGGTGASPYSSIKYAGIPWEMGLSESHQTLVRNGLRDRVVIETDGQLKTGHDVAIAALLGADEFGFSTAPLVAQGCIMMRKCHLNTCPVGIATQDPVLRQRFAGQPEYVINYFYFVATEVRQIMSQLGFHSMKDMIGRADALEFQTNERDILRNPKLAGLDLSALLAPSECLVTGAVKPKHQELSLLEKQIETWSSPVFKTGSPLTQHWNISNVDRSVGTRLSYHVVKHGGANGLPDDSLNLNFSGTAGQSFGAFLAKGISLHLTGTANDYVGKGLSGGTISIQGPKDLVTSGAISLSGNTCLYGATSGNVYIAGAAGERFAVRNSGAHAIIESVGDHGCEYMTGGEVIVLGTVGKNFAAGMSGGIAYVLDVNQKLHENCNLASVELIWSLDDQELDHLKNRIQAHFLSTQSQLAESLLKQWSIYKKKFVKVFPSEYKKILSKSVPAKEKASHTFEVERA